MAAVTGLQPTANELPFAVITGGVTSVTLKDCVHVLEQLLDVVTRVSV